MSLPEFDALIRRLGRLEIDLGHIAFRDSESLRSHLQTLPDARVEVIGQSREGRDLFGVRFGRGPLRVSIVAGSHADEPTGPMTAQALLPLLLDGFPEYLEHCSFSVVPQINPDGAERNRGWFASPPDFKTYVHHTVRELPGDDIEFGFGGVNARPECKAVMGFLEEVAPFCVHASLHGMGYAEGGWFLLCKEWASRGLPLMEALTEVCAQSDVPLHDIDRGDEKGFTRLRKGFCTTPTAAAMRKHFESLGDSNMAGRFQPSSMEFAQSLGGEPLCLVTEMPLFQVHGESSLEDPLYWRFRDALAGAKAEGRLDDLVKEYDVRAVPFAVQMKMQLALLLLGIRLATAVSGGSFP